MFSAPQFWNSKNLTAISLLPLSAIYLLLSRLRGALATAYHSSLPVLCIGNITVGGTGKTPLVAMIANMLAEDGLKVALLSRGYGGRLNTPTLVDPSLHDSSDVGDEALMLSHSHLVVVSPDRAAGARYIERHCEADLILMDDGMQHPWLFKDFIIGVFDGQRGLQNGLPFPSGPLRELTRHAMPRLGALFINGEDETALAQKSPHSLPLFYGQLEPYHQQIEELQDGKWLAFAGIGNPKRFFTMLEKKQVELVSTAAYADHHPYSEADLAQLQADAHHRGAELVTTHKDWIRLPSEWRERVRAVSVSMMISKADIHRLRSLLHQHIQPS